MDDQAILNMLKMNLEKPNSVADEYLQNLVKAAKSEIVREGITLADDEGVYAYDDANLIVMYAAYLYRNRVSTTEGYQTTAMQPQGMPYMLRLALNNHLFSQKMEISP